MPLMVCAMINKARFVLSGNRHALKLCYPDRNFRTGHTKGIFQRIARSITKAEFGSNHPGRFAVGIGQTLVSGTAALTIGGFAHYVLGIGKINPFVFDELPATVQERIITAYSYFGGSLAVSISSGCFCFLFLRQNPGLLRLIMNNSMAFIIASFGSQFLMGTVSSAMEYTEGLGLKQFLYICQSMILGMTAAPLILLGRYSISRAAYITTGFCGGLAFIGSNASIETFRGWEKPLSIGTSVVLATFVGYIVGGRMTRYGPILYRIFMHGGVVLFSAMFVYNANKIVHHAKVYPNYDPINESMRILMDTINIFGRLFFVLPFPRFVDGSRYKPVSKWNTRFP